MSICLFFIAHGRLKKNSPRNNMAGGRNFSLVFGIMAVNNEALGLRT